MPALNQSKSTSLGEWASAREDMRITCPCGRTINLPAVKIIERFRCDGPISQAITRLRCTTCGRRDTQRSRLFRSLDFSLSWKAMAQDKPTTVDEMQDLLAHLLVGAIGKTNTYWKT